MSIYQDQQEYIHRDSQVEKYNNAFQTQQDEPFLNQEDASEPKMLLRQRSEPEKPKQSQQLLQTSKRLANMVMNSNSQSNLKSHLEQNKSRAQFTRSESNPQNLKDDTKATDIQSLNKFNSHQNNIQQSSKSNGWSFFSRKSVMVQSNMQSSDLFAERMNSKNKIKPVKEEVYNQSQSQTDGLKEEERKNSESPLKKISQFFNRKSSQAQSQIQSNIGGLGIQKSMKFQSSSDLHQLVGIHGTDQQKTEQGGIIRVDSLDPNYLQNLKPKRPPGRLSKQQIASKQQAKQETLEFLSSVIQHQRRKTEHFDQMKQMQLQQRISQKKTVQSKKSESKINRHFPVQITINNQTEEEYMNKKVSQDIQSPETDKSRKKSVRFSESVAEKLETLKRGSITVHQGTTQRSKMQDKKRLSALTTQKLKSGQVSVISFEEQADLSARRKTMVERPSSSNIDQLEVAGKKNVRSSSPRGSGLFKDLIAQKRAQSFISHNPVHHNRRYSLSRIDQLQREIEKQYSEDKSQYSSSSEEENLPYPYNALPEQNWMELKQQLRKVNDLLSKADKEQKQNKPLAKQVPLHMKIFAARLLSISQNKSNGNDIEDDQSSNVSHSQRVLNDIGLSEFSKSQDPKSSRHGSVRRKRLKSRKTIVDPYQCTPAVQKKWRRLRNVILIVVRLLKIYNQVLMYGTSEKLLDINRGISKVRDMMIPIGRKVKNQDFSKNQPTDIFMWIPDSTPTKIWQSILIIMLLYTATILPYKLALIDDDNQELFVTDTIFDFLFIFDIYVNFNTPIEFKLDNYNFDRKKIAMNYINSWFLIDVMGSIPMNLIQLYILEVENRVKGKELIRIIRLPRLYRLVRILKVFQNFKSGFLITKIMLFFKFNPSAMRLLRLLLVVLLCVHIIGCLWILTATLSDEIYNTWIYRNSLQNADNYSIYLAAIYWAFQTLLTVGYGDIQAETNSELVIAVVWMLVGTFFYTLTIGNLTTVISNTNTRQSQINDKMSIINQFCKETNLDRALTHKLRSAVTYITIKNFAWADKIKIFEELPPNIKSEIAVEMHQGIIKKIRFFDDKDNNLIGSIVPLLTPLKIYRHEIIYKKDNHPNAIFFITQGRVSFFIERKNIAFKDMIEGCYFGDIEIIFKRKRRFTVISAVDSDFLTLSKNLFENIIIKDYPEIYEDMAFVAYEREKRIKDAKKKALIEYKIWKQQQAENIQTEQEDDEFIIDEADIYKLINDNQGFQEPTTDNPIETNSLLSPQIIQGDKQNHAIGLKRELSRINESSEKDNSISKGSQSSINKSKLSIGYQGNGPKKGILKKIKLVVKTEGQDQNSSLIQKKSNIEVAYILDKEPVEQKLNLLNNPIYDPEEKRFSYQPQIQQLDELKRESTVTSKSYGYQKKLMSQNSQKSRHIQKSLGSNLTIEKRNSIFQPDSKVSTTRGLRNEKYLSPNIGTIFKANQNTSFSKTLNEDDEEIISKVRSSKKMGRISKSNLNKLILKQQRSQDEEDEDEKDIRDKLKKKQSFLPRRSKTGIDPPTQSLAKRDASKFKKLNQKNKKASVSKQDLIPNQISSQGSNKIYNVRSFRAKNVSSSSSSSSSFGTSLQSSSDSEVNIYSNRKKQKEQKRRKLDKELDSDDSSISGKITDTVKSREFAFLESSKKKKMLRLNESIKSFKSKSTSNQAFQGYHPIKYNNPRDVQITEDEKSNRPKILLAEKRLNMRSETLQNIKHKISDKFNPQDLLRLNTQTNQEKGSQLSVKPDLGIPVAQSATSGNPKKLAPSIKQNSIQAQNKNEKRPDINGSNYRYDSSKSIPAFKNFQKIHSQFKPDIKFESAIRAQENSERKKIYQRLQNHGQNLEESYKQEAITSFKSPTEQTPLQLQEESNVVTPHNQVFEELQKEIIVKPNENDDMIQDYWNEDEVNLDKMRRNLQKDMHRLSSKLQKQAMSQRSLEHKIDNIGDTLNALIGQLVIIKENMQLDDDASMYGAVENIQLAQHIQNSQIQQNKI